MKKHKQHKQLKAPQEGLLFFSFNWDGKRQTHQHQLTPSEIRAIKWLLETHGVESVNSVMISMMMKNSMGLTEAVIARAFNDYIKKYKTVTVFDEAAPTIETALKEITNEATGNSAAGNAIEDSARSDDSADTNDGEVRSSTDGKGSNDEGASEGIPSSSNQLSGDSSSAG